MFDIKTVEIELGDKTLKLETGRVARQADGAVMATLGETVVLCAVTAAKSVKPGQDFFPLTVHYQEKFSAAGRIPGGFFKREGKPAEKEVLTSRVIDRPIRPLFPAGWRYETQVIALVLSADAENDTDILAITGASAALAISEIPFEKTIAGVRVGVHWSVLLIFGLIAFVAVTLGGFGNVAGAFVAGILIGVVEALAGYLFDPALKTIFVYLLFLGVLFFRPRGLLGVEVGGRALHVRLGRAEHAVLLRLGFLGRRLVGRVVGGVAALHAAHVVLEGAGLHRVGGELRALHFVLRHPLELLGPGRSAGQDFEQAETAVERGGRRGEAARSGRFLRCRRPARELRSVRRA